MAAGCNRNVKARIACLLIRNLPLAAIIRARPELKEAAFAVGLGKGPRAQLGFVSDAARRAGIMPGMTAAQGCAAIPDLIVIARASALESAAGDALLDAAQSFSPIVEDGGPGRAFLDLTGLVGLYGSETDMANELARRLRRVGMEADIGIATGKEVAYLAARCGGMRIIDTGRESEFLHWIPLEMLEISPEMELKFERLGIRRLGDLSRLSVRELGARMGAESVELIRLLNGDSGLPLKAIVPATVFTEKTELDYACELLEQLGFVLRGLLERLTARLALRSLTAGDLTLWLELSGHRHDDRHIKVSAATNEVRSLLTLILLELEKSPPCGAIETVALSVAARIRGPSQSDMFLPPAPAPERLQTTLARLAALCGPDQVGTLLPANSYRPEALERIDFAPADRTAAVPKLSSIGQLVLRALRPAQEIEVLFSRGMPDFVRGHRVCARVVTITGPWRRQGEWWRGSAIDLDGAGNTLDVTVSNGHNSGWILAHQASVAGNGHQQTPAAGFARDYYEMALDDGGVYRVFCDLRTNQWFMDGIYD